MTECKDTSQGQGNDTSLFENRFTKDIAYKHLNEHIMVELLAHLYAEQWLGGYF